MPKKSRTILMCPLIWQIKLKQRYNALLRRCWLWSSVNGWGPRQPHRDNPQCECDMLRSIQAIISSLFVAPRSLFPCYCPTPLMTFSPHPRIKGLTNMSKAPWMGNIRELREPYVCPCVDPSVCKSIPAYVSPCVCPSVCTTPTCMTRPCISLHVYDP